MSATRSKINRALYRSGIGRGIVPHSSNLMIPELTQSTSGQRDNQCVYGFLFVPYAVDRARQSFRQSFRMTSMRRSRRGQHAAASGPSSPPVADDSVASSASSNHDPEIAARSVKLESPREMEENKPFL